MFLIIGFGILGSVPVNPRQMRDPRWGSFWTSFAGPLSNLLQAILFAIALFVLSFFTPINAGSGLLILWESSVNIGSFSNPIIDFISLFFVVGIFYNVLLFVFNLLPLYPIDGWRMMLALLPGDGVAWTQIPAFIRQSLTPLALFLNKPAYKWSEWAQLTQYAFMILILVSFALPPQFDILSLLISRPTQRISFLLMGIGF
jgi:Zn-dependent protease